MRVAVPVVDEVFCSHFGRCTHVMLAEVDLDAGVFERPRVLERPSQGCDSLPTWLAELAVQTVIAGGIGGGAIGNLRAQGIAVSTGHTAEAPAGAIESFLLNPEGSALSGCDHAEHEHRHCKHK